MKFYVSAKWHFKDLVSKMQNRIKGEGHEIVADWTKRAYARSYDEMGKQSTEFAKEEVIAILNSDILIHISDNDGKGKYVDLGIALAGNTMRDKPKQIYVIGELANESQFYFHPSVTRIVTKDPMNALEQILERK